MALRWIAYPSVMAVHHAMRRSSWLSNHRSKHGVRTLDNEGDWARPLGVPVQLRRVIVEPEELIDPAKLDGGPVPARTATMKIHMASKAKQSRLCPKLPDPSVLSRSWPSQSHAIFELTSDTAVWITVATSGFLLFHTKRRKKTNTNEVDFKLILSLLPNVQFLLKYG